MRGRAAMGKWQVASGESQGTTRHSRLATCQSGAGLIEVLVTIVLIAFGLLSYAGMLAKSMQHNQSAYARSQATLLAYDIVERMRANRPAALAGSYNVAIGGTPSGGNVSGSDLAGWKANITQSLQAGDGSVAVDLQGNVTITLQWDDNRDGNLTVFTTQSHL